MNKKNLLLLSNALIAGLLSGTANADKLLYVPSIFNIPFTFNAASAGATILTLTDPAIGNASVTLGFGPASWISPAEFLIKNNVAAQNVAVLENDSAGGFSSLVIRANDHIEHSALGCSGSNANYLQTNTTCYYELSYFNGQNNANAVVTGSITTNVLTVTAIGSGTLVPGQAIYVPQFNTMLANTHILSQTSGTTGGIGTYTVDKSQTVTSGTINAAFTAPDWYFAVTDSITGTNVTHPLIHVYGTPVGSLGFNQRHVSFIDNNAANREMFGTDPVTDVVTVNFHLMVGQGNSPETPSLGTLDVYGNSCFGSATTSRDFTGCTKTMSLYDASPTLTLYKIGQKPLDLSINGTGASLEADFIDRLNGPITPLSIHLDGTGTIVAGGPVSMPNIASATAAQNGTVCWTTGGNITYDPSLGCLTSSLRFKHDWNLIPQNAALNIVMQLNPGTFLKKAEDGGLDDPYEQFGFLAEEVAKTDTRLVAYEPDGETVRGVRYPQMTAVLTGAVQELTHRVHRLQLEIWGLCGLFLLIGLKVFRRELHYIMFRHPYKA